jgi:hypothetical protein
MRKFLLAACATLATITPILAGDGTGEGLPEMFARAGLKRAGHFLAIWKVCKVDTFDIWHAYVEEAEAIGMSKTTVKEIATDEAAKIIVFVQRKHRETQFCHNK